MALPIFQRTVVTDTGDVVSGAEVTVVLEATGLNADIYADRDGTTPLTNPFFTGADGLAQFYADQGAYRITASGVSGGITWRYQELIDSSVVIQNTADIATNTADIATLKSSSSNVLIVKHTGASGTNGGVGTNGVWTDRTLNAESYNTIVGASLASDIVTLPAGKYKTNAVQQFVAADDCISRLYDNTNATTLLTGTAGFAGYNSVSSDTSTIEGVLELAAETDVKLQYWFSGATSLPYRLGRAVASGEDNTWAILRIERIGDV